MSSAVPPTPGMMTTDKIGTYAKEADVVYTTKT